MEKHAYFVRHGQSDSNLDGIYRGRGSMLTDKGREQAAIVAERVAKIGVEALISSDFPRALDTAAAISEKIGLSIEESALFGEWLQPSVNLSRHRDGPENQAVFTSLLGNAHDHHARHSDEESFHELVVRAEAGLRQLEAHEASRICVVTHGAFLTLLIGAVLFGEKYSKSEFFDFFRNSLTSNTGITYIRKMSDESGWQLMSWNDSAHLG